MTNSTITTRFMALKNLTVVLLFILLQGIVSPLAAQPVENQLDIDKNILLYLEAVETISNNALHHPSEQEIIKHSLKTYLKNIDRFSEYLTAKEYAAFKEIQHNKYIGIGMDIMRDESGQFACYPYPGGPADKAGIVSGDLLIAVNGKNIVGESKFALVGLTRGRTGTTLTLGVRNRNGNKVTFTLIRTPVQIKTVVLNFIEQLPVIRIHNFGTTTLRELKSTIERLQANTPLIIDLRKNPGGDLHSAIDAAMLFLKKDEKIVGVKKNAQVHWYTSYTDNVIAASVPIYVWQDHKTASAAEVFIAALTDNGRAVSIGTTTYGKGVKQDIFELQDGSAMVLTSSYLKTPNGTLYDKRGLTPTHVIEQGTDSSNSWATDIFISATKNLIRRKRTGGFITVRPVTVKIKFPESRN